MQQPKVLGKALKSNWLPLIHLFFLENIFKKYDTRRYAYNDQRNNQYGVGTVFHFINAVVNYRLLFQALCQNAIWPKTSANGDFRGFWWVIIPTPGSVS